MYGILLIMGTGILLGYLFRKPLKHGLLLDKWILWSIFLLLFMMGLSIGHDQLIMSSLPSLGLMALAISLSASLGSLVFALLLWHMYFKNRK